MLYKNIYYLEFWFDEKLINTYEVKKQQDLISEVLFIVHIISILEQ